MYTDPAIAANATGHAAMPSVGGRKPSVQQHSASRSKRNGDSSTPMVKSENTVSMALESAQLQKRDHSPLGGLPGGWVACKGNSLSLELVTDGETLGIPGVSDWRFLLQEVSIQVPQQP